MDYLDDVEILTEHCFFFIISEPRIRGSNYLSDASMSRNLTKARKFAKEFVTYRENHDVGLHEWLEKKVPGGLTNTGT
ncbi:unnamed protein product [marine sediment metagenome]|uniref:Uncharacterized protein n=1 Tax=marine sediment metagenome TaxID=412755 RepID=X0XHR3_9ZZZZ